MSGDLFKNISDFASFYHGNILDSFLNYVAVITLLDPAENIRICVALFLGPIYQCKLNICNFYKKKMILENSYEQTVIQQCEYISVTVYCQSGKSVIQNILTEGHKWLSKVQYIGTSFYATLRMFNGIILDAKTKRIADCVALRCPLFG